MRRVSVIDSASDGVWPGPISWIGQKAYYTAVAIDEAVDGLGDVLRGDLHIDLRGKSSAPARMRARCISCWLQMAGASLPPRRSLAFDAVGRVMMSLSAMTVTSRARLSVT